MDQMIRGLMNKKLAIQIPAFNEENTIADVIIAIPRSIAGIQDIEIIVINDGSTDNTRKIAQEAGAKHVINFPRHYGLAKAHKTGLAHALKIEADIIVNLDADFQYRPDEIPKIIKPILDGKADMVIGDRQLKRIKNYPLYKFLSQSIGNFLATIVLHNKIKDATSGFRAYTKEAAGILVKNLQNNYTATLESICILAKKKMQICFIPINIQYPTRKSRLITSKAYYAMNFLSTLFKFYRSPS